MFERECVDGRVWGRVSMSLALGCSMQICVVKEWIWGCTGVRVVLLRIPPGGREINEDLYPPSCPPHPPRRAPC